MGAGGADGVVVVVVAVWAAGGVMVAGAVAGGIAIAGWAVGRWLGWDLMLTVTMYYTGKLRQVTAQELVLTDAAWIADTGRFSEALRTGTLSEVEPFPEGQVVIGRGAIVD